jgi:cytochrome c oxidase subunit 1
MYLAVLASMIHGFTIPAGIEVGQRLRGVTQGVFGWLKKAPWGDPGFAALATSLVIFGFVGGITGVTFGTEQINLIAHNTLRIPGHFHATVVGGTALAFMGTTYYLIPLIFRRQVALWPLARIQPYVFAVGMLIFSVAMTFAGTFGVPRRHWDITFSGAMFDLEYSPAVDLVIGVMAVGGLIAATGGLLYIVITVWSVFLGRPFQPAVGAAATASGMHGVPQGILSPPAPLHGRSHDEAGTPGTLVLVFVFLAAFALYYFVNWKLLSVLWRIG